MTLPQNYDGQHCLPVFKMRQLVEKKGEPGVPWMVIASKSGVVPRYTLQTIDGDTHENYPEYLMLPHTKKP